LIKPDVKTANLFCVLLVISLGGAAQTHADINETGIRLMEKGQYKQALPIFEKLVYAEPDNAVFRYNRAVTCFNLKRYKEALHDYLWLAEEYPEDPEYQFQIGNLYYELNQQTKVAAYYNRAIALDGDNFMYYFKRGTYYMKADRYDLALADFNKSLGINPRHANSLHNRGIIQYRTGQTDKACEDWCQAQLLGSSISGIHMEKNCKVYPQACLLSKVK
jgi:tetratricopeptide (TPR) repeat protein